MRHVVWGCAILLTGCPENDFTRVTDTAGIPHDTGDTGVEPDDGIPDDVPVGGVQGRICAPNENVYVAGAKAAIEHEYGLSQTFTDADGYFTLTNVPAGDRMLVVEKGSFHVQIPVYIPQNEIVELAEEECLEQEDLNIAVVTGQYDSIGSIISHLGLEYDAFNGLGSEGKNFLRDPERMAEYDIIFLNCGLNEEILRPSLGEIGDNIRDYANEGGSVYASDWAYFVIEEAFPSMVDFRGDDSDVYAARVGYPGTYEVSVLDPMMITALGGETTANLRYDLGSWVTPVGSGGGGSPMVYGTYEYINSNGSVTNGEGPLAVELPTAGGNVVYTTFHNEAQMTLDMEVLLQEIIWAL